MGVHKYAFFLSIFLILSSITLLFSKGLNLGIDFAGGILIEARFDDNTKISDLRNSLENKNLGKITLQQFDKRDFIIKVAQDKNIDQNITIKNIKETLNQDFTKVEYRKVDFVGPQIGAEMVQKGVLALLLSFFFMMIYIWIRFDWQFGVGAIISLFHDAIIAFGIFSLIGFDFNSSSIAAVLTIIGYSINDSVVIYDRIRENLRKFKKMEIVNLLNLSINLTLLRTILTSGTTLLALASLILFGGEALKSFSIVAFLGIIIGTYSSIYISAPILLYFNPRNNNSEAQRG
jgi:preprotein translocase subunit SecF